MRVFFDGEIFTKQRYGGVSMMFRELASRLPVLDSSVKITTFRFPDDLASATLRRREWYFVPKVGGFLRRLDSVALGTHARQAAPDIYHPTFYRIPADLNMPVVVTIHDLIPRFFDDVAGAENMRRAKDRALARADHVIAVSENTRDDLLELTPLGKDTVSVVYPAPNPKFREAAPRPETLHVPIPSEYLLYVGGRQSYKNFLKLLDAYGSWRENDRYALVCAGGRNHWSDKEQNRIENYAIGDRVHLFPDIDDRALHTLYDGASALVYPSLYEGFGIPPLEAMCCDTPVIAADRASIPEVVGDAALLVDPSSVVAIREALSAVLKPQVRAELIANGSERVSRFTWVRTTRETLSVYKQLLSSRGTHPDG
jgi:glycosyltransferase involved in cell wall biosynthesis